MDRNSVIGLILIAILLVAYTYYQRPGEEQITAQEQLQDSLANQENPPATAAVAGAQEPNAAAGTDSSTAADSLQQAQRITELKSRYGMLAKASVGTAEEITVETELLKITFSNRGGVPVRAELKKFNTYDSLPLVLFEPQRSKLDYAFTYPSLGTFRTSEFYFESGDAPEQITGDSRANLVYTLALPDGRSLINTYTITGNSYDIHMSSAVKDMSGIMTDVRLVWEMSASHSEKSIEAERNNSTIFYKEEGYGRDYLSETGEDETLIEDQALNWLAFKQNFFSSILIGDEPFGEGSTLQTSPYPEENDSLTQYYHAEIPLLADASGELFSGKLFMGPNDYKLLRSYDMELWKIINLGWGIFGWVNRFLVIPIFDWLQDTGLSYGIIILILTLVIKMLLMPLTFKNYLSSARMRVLKPEIDAINEKHKDADPMKKQQATMELYRKTGVSPFAGCIPMLIQLPILYAMFRFFPSSIQLRHESFLWADDLSSYDSIASLPFTIPAYGDHVSLFTLLMCASTFVYTITNSSQMPTQNQPGMPNMKIIMYIFPFMMLFFFNSFASGLSYYYFLANVISILQMLVIKHFFIDEEKIKLKIAENKKKRAKQGKSKFQQKLEEMAKQRGINTK